MRRMRIWKIMVVALAIGLAYYVARVWVPRWYAAMTSVQVPADADLELIGNVGPKAAGEEHTLDELLNRADDLDEWRAAGRRVGDRLVELLRQEGVAPVGRICEKWLQRGAGAQPPAAGSPILRLPELPPGYSNMHAGDSYADGTIAATVYGYTPEAAASVPCILAINDGVATGHTGLVSELNLNFSWIVPYNQGQGLLVFVDGSVPLSRDWRDLEGWQGLFVLEAPQWIPRLVADSKSLGLNNLVSLIGQSADGSRVWLFGGWFQREHKTASGVQLWVYDAIADTTDLVCDMDSDDVHIEYVIPSPDGKLIALGSRFFVVPFSSASNRRNPLRVVDCRTNAMHTLTRSGRWMYLHQPVGWSAAVPRRLYFTDLERNVWRLDIP